MKFEIKNNGKLTEAFIDGKKIEGLQGITFSADLHSLPVIHLDLINIPTKTEDE